MPPRLRLNTLARPQRELPPLRATGNYTVYTPFDSKYIPENAPQDVDKEEPYWNRDIQDIVTAYTIVASRAPASPQFKTMYADCSMEEFKAAVSVFAGLPEWCRFGLHHLHTQVCNTINQYLLVNDRTFDARYLAVRANYLSFPGTMAAIEPIVVLSDFFDTCPVEINRNIFPIPPHAESHRGCLALRLYLAHMGRWIMDPMFYFNESTVCRHDIEEHERSLVPKFTEAEALVRLDIRRGIDRAQYISRDSPNSPVVSTPAISDDEGYEADVEKGDESDTMAEDDEAIPDVDSITLQEEDEVMSDTDTTIEEEDTEEEAEVKVEEESTPHCANVEPDHASVSLGPGDIQQEPEDQVLEDVRPRTVVLRRSVLNPQRTSSRLVALPR
ncbi:hypothetical protein SBRCBS47491_001000 [Sporothrix bragantina]|uniref:Uncharacterized protein n=1 Tax=Sporothrix bragantina TaxID=671064 RepID=A0ABP0AUZ1_9PEZI